MEIRFAVGLCVIVALYAKQKGSLSNSGIIASFIVGIPTFRNDFHIFAAILLFFFVIASRVTRIGRSRKEQLEDGYEKSSMRGAWQVLCNGGLGAIIALTHYFAVDGQKACFLDDKFHSAALVGYVAIYSCCCGDTFASELGILDSSPPLLITTLQPVPPGIVPSYFVRD